MLDRHSIARRMIALLGIVLTLLLNLQQSHALCALDACEVTTQSADDGASDCQPPSAGGCCHRQRASATQSPEPAAEITNIPCDGQCWLCRAPVPWTPICGPVDAVQLSIVAVFAETPIHNADHACDASLRLSASVDLLGTASTDTCARLCRYLI